MARNDNINNSPDNVIFTVKSTKLYVPVPTVSAKDNQKLSKLLERSVYWNQSETKSKNKNTTNNYLWQITSIIFSKL